MLGLYLNRDHLSLRRAEEVADGILIAIGRIGKGK
jgi:hypothetical protein